MRIRSGRFARCSTRIKTIKDRIKKTAVTEKAAAVLYAENQLFGLLCVRLLPHAHVVSGVEQERRGHAEDAQSDQDVGKALRNLRKDQENQRGRIENDRGQLPVPFCTGDLIRLPDRDIARTTQSPSKTHSRGRENARHSTRLTWVSLSARGSSAFPRSETIWNLLAILPSNTSVRAERATRTMVRVVFFSPR